MKLPRFRIKTLMVVVAVVAFATWGWVLFAGMDAESKKFILVIVGTLGAVPVFALSVATLASVLGRWSQPAAHGGDKAGERAATARDTIDRHLDRIWREER